MKTIIHTVSFQRNGVQGEGFYTVHFLLKDGETFPNMIATFKTQVDNLFKKEVIEEEDTVIDYSSCRVVNADDVTSAWRGDEIGYQLQRDLDAMRKTGETIYDLTTNFAEYQKVIENEKKKQTA
jgi:hypothetical protein